MRSFIQFVEQKSEEQKNLKATIDKLPKKHRMLLANFKIKLTCKNTLDNDTNHIGNINKYDIVVAAPWNYGREFTTLHEIAHLIFEKLVTEKQKQEWNKLCKKFYNKKPKMNCEEVFCMVYASNYSTHHIETYNIPELTDFIKTLD